MSAVAAKLNEQQRWQLARAVALASPAAAVAVLSSIRSMQLPATGLAIPRAMKQLPMKLDAPKCLTVLEGLQELTMRLQMDGSGQRRTGLASLSALQRLSCLTLSLSMDPDCRCEPLVGCKRSAKLQQRHAKAQQVQRDLLQVTTAAGQLTQLTQLQLNIQPSSTKLFQEVLSKSLCRLSRLTQLASLGLSCSVLASATSGLGLTPLSRLSGLTSISLEETGQLNGLSLRQTKAPKPGQESTVAALGRVWPALQQLRQLRLRSLFLSAGVLQQLQGLPGGTLWVLDVTDCAMSCEGAFAAKLAQLTALQELHASNTVAGGRLRLSAAGLSAAAAGLAASLTRLDISKHTYLQMAGSVSALAQLTQLRHLDAYGSRIAAADGSVCGHLTRLTQLSFLSVGSVQRSVMVVPAEDAARLSALTGLRQLQLQGAQLGPAADSLHWLAALTQLSSLRLWGCRFRGVAAEGARLAITKLLPRLEYSQLQVRDSMWYAGEDMPASDSDIQLEWPDMDEFGEGEFAEGLSEEELLYDEDAEAVYDAYGRYGYYEFGFTGEEWMYHHGGHGSPGWY